MLLLINDDRELSLAERRFAEWISWSPNQPGVVLMNIEIPDTGHSRQVDALIWTPQRCIAVEVKGFRTRQHGALVVHPNGPWRMDDGRVADIYGNDYRHNPINQVRANTLAVKNWINSRTGRRCFVHGLVVTMLLPGQNVPSLRAPHTPNQIDIIVEDFDVFRYYLHRPADPIEWTGEQVAAVIEELGLAHLHSGTLVVATALGERPTLRAGFDYDAPF